MYKYLFMLACMAYKLFLRSLIKKAVDNPNEDYDEVLLGILDNIFRYATTTVTYK